MLYTIKLYTIKLCSLKYNTFHFTSANILNIFKATIILLYAKCQYINFLHHLYDYKNAILYLSLFSSKFLVYLYYICLDKAALFGTFGESLFSQHLKYLYNGEKVFENIDLLFFFFEGNSFFLNYFVRSQKCCQG